MRNRFTAALTGLFFFALGLSGLAQTPAATPDENPEGNTGALKAQIETAGSYDAHSGNATRSVTDLHVPGALGVYGLDFTRHWNSTQNDYDNPYAKRPTYFGSSGWSHSWAWSAVCGEDDTQPGGDGTETVFTTSITITFPDGHANKYKIVRYSQAHGTLPADPRFGPPYTTRETNFPTVGQGVHDYLGNMATDGSSFWLYRADGGSVHFVGNQPPDTSSGHNFWTYRATEIFDPHGLKTTLTYTANKLEVKQDGGRWLNILSEYRAGSLTPVIIRVETGGYAGVQSVTYDYTRFPDPVTGTFLTLTKVTYPDDTAPGDDAYAIYTYENYFGETNSAPYSSSPLLKTANDPHFAGAMTRIRYNYRGSGCFPTQKPPNDPPEAVFDYFYAQPTAVKAERSGSQVDQFNQRVNVSSFEIYCFDGTRKETNGLGAWRMFSFGRSAGEQGTFHCMGYELAKLTDFTNVNPAPANLPFERQNYMDSQPRQVWDGRGILTELVATPGDASGQPGEIRHVGSDGSIYKYDRVNPGTSAARDTARIPNPYNHWLFSKTDERGQKTTYTRDARRRVTHIAYPDGTSEDFTYDPLTNQVLSHTLPSGAKVYYEYDSWHRLWREWNDVDGVDEVKIYTYDGLERVLRVSDARSRAAGKDASVAMHYNGRHQVLSLEYAAMIGAPDNPTVRYGYDDYGNCTSITDELGYTPEPGQPPDPAHTCFFTFDDYRRCTSYTEPLNAPDWKRTPGVSVPSRTWNWTYDRVGANNASISAYAHTSKNWRLQIEPAHDAAGNRRAKVRNYDYNGLLTFEYDSIIQAPNGSWTYPADAAMHSYTYDKNGQKEKYTDPQGRDTTYTYDNRNRLWKTNETVNTIPRTTETLYDYTGNKTLVKYPDLKTQQWLDYDAFGQPGRFIDERNNTTNLTYWWGPMKKLRTVTTHRIRDDGATEDQPTTFMNDGMGRPLQTSFPDGSYENTGYEFGQLKTFQTRKGQIKTVVYDERGREQSHSFSDTTPDVTRVWDKANRLSSISNIFSTIDYTYDNAGQVITEGNAIAGASAGKRVTTYSRYLNGETAHITYPGGFLLRRDYTTRGQLQITGTDDASGAWVAKLAEYVYLADGKVQSETGLNGVQTLYGYDGRGQINTINTQRVSPAQRYSYRTYTRDTRDRISAWSKSASPTYNILENGRGDRYGYDYEGQLTGASYEALTPETTPTGALRTESFVYDALGNRKGVNQVAGRGAVSFLRRDNKLNQYLSWTPSAIYYDDNYPGCGPGGNGVMMAEGWITASYNSLNQPVAIWSPTYSGTSNYMWFGFDPLGRCVKRWVGPSGAATTPTATYFYYEGWNLIQESAGAAAAGKIYVHGNRVDEIVADYDYASPQWRFHHYDARGHCVLLTDRNGGLIEQYEYDAFGKPYIYNANGVLLSASGNRFLFTGREWLSDLKLYDFRNRLYQPELGRFLQPDPKQFEAGDYNLYRYCHNDPVNKVDPDGLAPEWIHATLDVIGAVEPTPFADLTNAVLYAVAGDKTNAGIAVAGVVPYVGDLGKAGKYGSKVYNRLKAAEHAADARRLRELPGLDQTGKVHGLLPRRQDLGRLSSDDLKRLNNDLKKSVQERHRTNAELGSDKGHDKRLTEEQQLIHLINKELRNR